MNCKDKQINAFMLMSEYIFWTCSKFFFFFDLIFRSLKNDISGAVLYFSNASALP